MNLSQFARNLISAPNVRDSKAADPFRSVLNRMTMFGGYRNGDREDTNNAYALAMTSAWAYSDIRLIGDRLASSDARMKVQRKDSNGELADEKGHEFHALLNRPNSLMPGSFLLRYTSAWYNLRGNGYLFISTPGIGRGRPMELWPLPANQVLPRPDLLHEGRGVFAGEAVINYQYNVNGALEILPGENIIHFRMPNPFDWWEGLSPLQAAILGVQSDHAQAVWQRDFFKEDNAIPSAIISVPADTNEIDFDRQREMLSEQLRNGQKRLFTRSGDLTVQMISQTLEQMQIIQSRQFNREEIDAVYNIPKGLISGGLSGDSRLAAEIAFARNAIQPMLDYFAEQMNADLAPYYGEDVVIVAPNIIPQDRALEVQEYTIYAQDRTINENRKKIGLDDIKLDSELSELQPFVSLPVRLITAALTQTGAQNVEILSGGSASAPTAPQVGALAGAQDPGALVQAQAGKGLAPVGERSRTEQIAIDTELARWKKVALKAMRDGKPQREFASEVIPTAIKAVVTDNLPYMADEAAINQLFAKAKASVRFVPRGNDEPRPVVPTALDITDDDIEHAIKMWDSTFKQYAGLLDAEVA